MTARIAAGLLLLAMLVVLVAGALAPASWQAAIATDGPGCPFHWITGLACPFCGMTRATLALGRGDLHGALALHPLAPVVLVGVAALLVIVASGRVGLLLRGRRPYALIGTLASVWVLRFVV